MFEIECFTGGFTMTNGYLLRREDESNILIDAPEGIAKWLNEQGVPVKALLLTHHHFDHVLDAALVRSFQNCPVYAFAPYSTDLTLEAMLAGFGMPIQVAPYEVDHLLEGSDELKVAGWTFKLFHVPGHSPDSVCFLPLDTTVDGETVLIGGDVLFQGSIGRTDFPNSDHEALITGIQEKLYTLPAGTIVYPGHGPWTTIGTEIAENPYV